MKVDISSTFENFCLALQQTKHRVSGGALLHYARVAWEAHELNLELFIVLAAYHIVLPAPLRVASERTEFGGSKDVYTHTHTHKYVCMYIYIYLHVSVCVRERERVSV